MQTIIIWWQNHHLLVCYVPGTLWKHKASVCAKRVNLILLNVNNVHHYMHAPVLGQDAPVCTSAAAGKNVGIEQHGVMPIKVHEKKAKLHFCARRQLCPATRTCSTPVSNTRGTHPTSAAAA